MTIKEDRGHPPETRSGAPTPAATAERPAPHSSRVLVVTKAVFWALLAMLVLNSALALAGAADPALAQDQQQPKAGQPKAQQPAGGGGGSGGGGGDPISGFLQAVIDSVSGWVTLAGVLGLLVCAVLKAVAGTNEHRHHMANAGFVGCGIAVAAGLMAQPIVDMISGWAGGGA